MRQIIRANDFLLPLEYPDLANALLKHRSGGSLNEYEKLIMDRAISTMLYNWQFVHNEYRQGRIDEDSIPKESWRRAFNGIHLGQGGYWPDLRDYWHANKEFRFSPEFVEWMEDNVVER